MSTKGDQNYSKSCQLSLWMPLSGIKRAFLEHEDTFTKRNKKFHAYFSHALEPLMNLLVLNYFNTISILKVLYKSILNKKRCILCIAFVQKTFFTQNFHIWFDIGLNPCPFGYWIVSTVSSGFKDDFKYKTRNLKIYRLMPT